MIKKRIDTTLHYAQFIGVRFGLVVIVGFLIYSIWIQRTSGIVFSTLFLIYVLFLLKKVFDKPTELSFDENHIYLNDGAKHVDLKNITLLKRGQIFYHSEGKESKIKLPNFYFLDKNWKELKQLIDRNKQ